MRGASNVEETKLESINAVSMDTCNVAAAMHISMKAFHGIFVLKDFHTHKVVLSSHQVSQSWTSPLEVQISTGCKAQLWCSLQ